MKKILDRIIISQIILFSLALFLPEILSAQRVQIFDVANVRLDSWERVEDSVRLALSVSLNGQKLKTQKEADICPVISDGENKLLLRQFSLMGKQRYKAYQRYMNYRGRNTSFPEDPMFVLLADGSATTAKYSCTAPYQEWMKEASVSLDSYMCKCGDLHDMRSSDFLTDKLQNNERLVVRTDTVKLVKESRIYEMRCDLMLTFKVNKTDIRFEYGNNATEIARVDEMLSKVLADKKSKIKSIRVVGFASPEGPLLNNENLSKGRSLVLAHYLSEKYALNEDKFHVEFGGENWQGLKTVLSKSQYSFKKEILNIINSTEDSHARKQRIMEFDGGRPYQILLKEVYPWLRRTEVILQIEKH